MIGRARAELGEQLGRAEIAKLTDVRTDAEPARPGRGQDRAGLRERERTVVAVDIDARRESVRGGAGYPALDDVANERVAIRQALGRDQMSEQGRDRAWQARCGDSRCG